VFRRLGGLAAAPLLVASLAFMVAVATAGAASEATPASAAPAKWSTLGAESPVALAANELDGVACWTAGGCVGVGHAAAEPGQPALVEDLGASGWTLAATPPAPGSYRNYLEAVSCTSAEFCVAVGYYQDNALPAEPLIETYDNGTWSVTPGTGPGKGGNYLTGVSCSAAGSCVAVGYYSNEHTDRVLVETLAGGTWSLTPAADLGYGANELAAVSCPTSGQCYAVGYYKGGAGTDQALVEDLVNGTWTIAPAVDQGTKANRLEGLSCPVAGTCVAVGTYFNGHAYQTLAEGLAGGSWALERTPDASVANNALASVSCPVAGTCTAVGSYSDGRASQSLVEGLSGGSWHHETSPEQPGGGNTLAGVSCPAVATCSAVGGYSVAGADQVLALSSSGSAWSLVSAEGQDSPQASLDGVSCPAAGNCVAVGSSPGQSGAAQALAETYASGSWAVAVVAAPAGTEASYLSGVSCPALGSCVAVGYDLSTSGTAQALAEVDSAGAWTVAPLPLPSTTGSYLSGVSCPTIGSCVAVGYDIGASGTPQALVESYSGGTWSVSPAPLPASAGSSYLSGVSCPAAGTCVAVGHYSSAGGSSSSSTRTLVEGLSGSSWSVLQSADDGNGANALDAVSCPTTSSCYAVGYYWLGAAYRPLVEAIAGPAGAATISTAPSPAGGYLVGVSCSASSVCAAVGHRSGPYAEQALVEVLTNGSWVVAPSYDSSPKALNGLAGDSCAGTSCVAVGSYRDGSALLALAESGRLAAASTSTPTTSTAPSTTAPVTTAPVTTAPVTTAPVTRTTRPATRKAVATATAISSVPNPLTVGQRVTYRAVIRPAPIGGTVTFTDDGVSLVPCRTVPVSARGVATCSVVYSAPGDHVIEALYSGAAAFASSVSGPYGQLVVAPAPPAQGYWLATRLGDVLAAGASRHLGSFATTGKNPLAAIAATSDGNGYWVVAADGMVRAFGDAHYYGGLLKLKVHVDDIVAIEPTPDNRGYWLVGRDGGLFAFGDAVYKGSLVAEHRHVADVVGMASVPGGYLVATSGGGVFSFGKAHFYGSLAERKAHVGDIKAIVSEPGGTGYLLVGAHGSVYTFGSGAHFYGSLPAEHVGASDIVGIALTPDHLGYFLAGANGAVYGFGDAHARPSPPGLAAHLPVVAIAGR
jgi:hypothetical protein